MSEVMNDIYNDAYNAAINSGASDNEAAGYADSCCNEIRNCLYFD